MYNNDFCVTSTTSIGYCLDSLDLLIHNFILSVNPFILINSFHLNAPDLFYMNFNSILLLNEGMGESFSLSSLGPVVWWSFCAARRLYRSFLVY